jgi:hypothetical protein
MKFWYLESINLFEMTFKKVNKPKILNVLLLSVLDVSKKVKKPKKGTKLRKSNTNYDFK